jgi:hypothetical protein
MIITAGELDIAFLFVREEPLVWDVSMFSYWFGTRDAFYKTPFGPKTFCDKSPPKNERFSFFFVARTFPDLAIS